MIDFDLIRVSRIRVPLLINLLKLKVFLFVIGADNAWGSEAGLFLRLQQSLKDIRFSVLTFDAHCAWIGSKVTKRDWLCFIDWRRQVRNWVYRGIWGRRCWICGLRLSYETITLILLCATFISILFHNHFYYLNPHYEHIYIIFYSLTNSFIVLSQ